MLTLPIKGVYFTMIEHGEKLEEYRDLTPYYKSRFKSIFAMYPYSYVPEGWDRHTIRLRNGYATTSPTLEVTCTLDIGRGREKWGAVSGKDYYILKIIETKRIV